MSKGTCHGVCVPLFRPGAYLLQAGPRAQRQNNIVKMPHYLPNRIA